MPVYVSSKHALSVGKKARENMEKWQLCHFCSGSYCGSRPSIDLWRLIEWAESRYK